MLDRLLLPLSTKVFPGLKESLVENASIYIMSGAGCVPAPGKFLGRVYFLSFATRVGCGNLSLVAT